MKKILISMIVEVNENNISKIKHDVFDVVSQNIVSCSVSEICEKKEPVDIPSFI